MGIVSTSKIILIAVIGVGLVCLFMRLFDSPLQLGAYGLIFAGALYNRVDSRFRGYKFSVSVAGATATVEAGAVNGGQS